MRTRRVHHVNATALYILQHRAYKHYCLVETRDAHDFRVRWIPVHLKDMAELATKHPNVFRKFREGAPLHHSENTEGVLFNPD